jgi:uncharacterized membrane protein YeaQ/YmgE (transglycosylase-associated protein family)
MDFGQYLSDEYSWLGWIVIGFIAGLIARAVTPGRDPNGCIVTVLLGVGGALLAGFIGQQMGWRWATQGAGFLAAIGGAILILIVYRVLASRR